MDEMLIKLRSALMKGKNPTYPHHDVKKNDCRSAMDQ